MIQQTLIFPFSVMSSFSYPRLPDLWPLLGQDEASARRSGTTSLRSSRHSGGTIARVAGRVVSVAVHSTRKPPSGTSPSSLIFWGPILVTVIAAIAWSVAAAHERLRGGISGGDPRTRPRPRARHPVSSSRSTGRAIGSTLMMIYPPCLLVARRSRSRRSGGCRVPSGSRRGRFSWRASGAFSSSPSRSWPISVGASSRSTLPGGRSTQTA